MRRDALERARDEVLTNVRATRKSSDNLEALLRSRHPEKDEPGIQDVKLKADAINITSFLPKRES